jgi:hypothetical protein
VEAVKTSDEEGNYDGTMDDPTYTLLCRLGEIYRDGGHGLDKNPTKAGTSFINIYFFYFGQNNFNKNILISFYQLITSVTQPTQPWPL